MTAFDKVNDKQTGGDQISQVGDGASQARYNLLDDALNTATYEGLNSWNRTVGSVETFAKDKSGEQGISFTDAYNTLQSTQKGGMMGGFDAGRDANEERKLGGSAISFAGSDIYGISDTAAKGADDAFQQMLERNNRKAA